MWHILNWNLSCYAPYTEHAFESWLRAKNFEIQGKQVGNGKPGKVFKAVDTLLFTDMNANVETDPIPYS